MCQDHPVAWILGWLHQVSINHHEPPPTINHQPMLTIINPIIIQPLSFTLSFTLQFTSSFVLYYSPCFHLIIYPAIHLPQKSKPSFLESKPSPPLRPCCAARRKPLTKVSATVLGKRPKGRNKVWSRPGIAQGLQLLIVDPGPIFVGDKHDWSMMLSNVDDD